MLFVGVSDRVPSRYAFSLFGKNVFLAAYTGSHYFFYSFSRVGVGKLGVGGYGWGMGDWGGE